MEIRHRSSPNHGPRRGGARPDLVVLHYTAMESSAAALDRLCDPEAAVSAHYLIGEAGTVWQLVDEAERAWHAGVGQWGAVADVNSRSIGIELANPASLDGFPPFPEAQIAALEALLDTILARWSIAPARVIAHSDLAPGRKADPGGKFDWRRLALGGRAVWPGCVGLATADPLGFRIAAEAIGYRAPDGDWGAVLDAFRLRFRPMGCGALATEDVALARAVAAEHPCVDAGAPSA